MAAHKVYCVANHEKATRPRSQENKGLHDEGMCCERKGKQAQKAAGSFSGLTRLALLATLSRAARTPIFTMGQDVHLRKDLRRFRGEFGLLNTVKLHNQGNDKLVGRMHEHLKHCTTADCLLSKTDMFCLIVDSGASISTSPDRKDFIQYEKLDEPIRVNGVGGEVELTHGGILHFEAIDTKGEVQVIETFGFHNPNMEYRLFSPQRYFCENKMTNRSFTVKWGMCQLQMNDTSTIEFPMDETSFLPFMPVFHDAASTAKQLGSFQNLNEQMDNLTFAQRLLKRHHDKLGHLGFQHVQWLGRCGFFGPQGKRFGRTTVIPPGCEACNFGGQERRPIEGNHKSQENKDILKKGALKPGDRVFSDQYVSSLEGYNFNSRGQML